MSKSNLIILGVVVVIAAIFMIQYANPENSLGAEEQRSVNSAQVREILLLEAEEQNITITEVELKSAFLGLRNKSNMDNESYDAFIIERHGSRENFDAFLESNLKVLKLINDQIDWSRISIKDEEIDKFIEKNPEIFPPEQLRDPIFKETLYDMARQQMFENQRQQLIDEYVSNVVTRYQGN